MHRFLMIALCWFLFSASTTAQSLKKPAQPFTIFQDNNKEALFTLQVPEGSTINTEFNFAMYVSDKTNLSISYELDDDPAITKETELAAYAKKLSNKDIGGEDVTVSNKKMASKTETINGIKTLSIQYDYAKKAGTQKASERGKVFLYLVPVRGTSLLNDKEHLMVVRLSFDYNQTSGNTANLLYKEIIATLQSNK